MRLENIFNGDNISLIILWGLLIIFAVIAYQKGLFFAGLTETKNLTLNFITRLAAAFLLAGFATVLVPQGWIEKWMGVDSGWSGIIVAWIAGALAPGGPFLAFPILAVIYEKGASMAAIFTFLTSWALIGGFRIITWELPFMGLSFVSIRLAVSFLIPLIVGIITKIFIEK